MRLRAGDPSAATLGFVAAVALDEVVAALVHEADVRLKWPNDLLIDGAKLSGILLERADEAIVVGIGVNVAAAPEVAGRRTTSLAAQGAAVGAAAVLEMLVEAFARWLGRWRAEGFATIRARWLARAHPAGTALRVQPSGGEAIDGLFDGLDANGALILRLASGERRVMHAADVFLLA